MKLQQTSLDQTGIAILIMKDESVKFIPLFSSKPIEEAHDLVVNYFPDCLEINHIYFTNNLMDAKIEDTIEKYREGHPCLPEDYMEELLSGFPYIFGEPKSTIPFYS